MRFNQNTFFITKFKNTTDKEIESAANKEVKIILENPGFITENVRVIYPDYFFLLGEKLNYKIENNFILIFKKDEFLEKIFLKNLSKVSETLMDWIKIKLLEKCKLIQREMEKIMNIPEHTISLKTSRTYHAQHRKNHITYNINVYPFPDEIIRFLATHELCHYVHPNHSKLFYEMLFKYCPNHKLLKIKLNKGVVL
ncbi:conserved hypothetical protein [Mycoplasmopsis alligatoris A21JP2]|uniref:YgjP-like metallopeptidase domain-containing protein n=1 Tax=Mycoplasmopsis alligatoris A21JP2 TaxID=747682 RepID=D4XWE6_9BACT|nr:conserved hypothetical protein [Mycoplasmopsis alligatoris A21JP2]